MTDDDESTNDEQVWPLILPTHKGGFFRPPRDDDPFRPWELIAMAAALLMIFIILVVTA